MQSRSLCQAGKYFIRLARLELLPLVKRIVLVPRPPRLALPRDYANTFACEAVTVVRAEMKREPRTFFGRPFRSVIAGK